MTEPRQDPIVQALVPDPLVGPPSVAVLKGYFGQSTAPDHSRLYLSRALDRYVDIPEDKILHTSQLPDNEGTRVWVPKSLKLEYVRTVSAEVQARFLQGSIAGRHLPVEGAALAEAAARARPRWRMIARDDWPESIHGDCDTQVHCWSEGACPE